MTDFRNTLSYDDLSRSGSSLLRRGAIKSSSLSLSSGSTITHRLSTSTVSSTSSTSSASASSVASTTFTAQHASASNASYIDLLYPLDPVLESYHSERVRENRERMSADFFAKRKAERKGLSRNSSYESEAGLDMDGGERELREKEADEKERVVQMERGNHRGFMNWERRRRSEIVRVELKG